MSPALDATLRVLPLLFAVLSSVYAWQSGRHRATRQQLERVLERVRVLELANAKLEERVQGLPSGGELANLRIEIGGLQGELRGIRDGLSRLTIHADRVDTYMQQRFG